MPEPDRLYERECFQEPFFLHQVGDHLFDRDMIITDCGRLPIAFKTQVLQFYNKGRLMGLGPPGYREGVAESEIIRIVVTIHGGQK
jgi:hypothetical protein